MRGNVRPIGSLTVAIPATQTAPFVSAPIEISGSVLTGLGIKSDGDITGATIEFLSRIPADTANGLPATDYQLTDDAGNNYVLTTGNGDGRMYSIPTDVSNSIINLVMRITGLAGKRTTIILFGSN